MPLLLLSLAALLLAACGSDAPPCVQNLSLNCQPLYDPPIYSTLFTRTFHPTCATGQGTCHTTDAAKAGLVFEEIDQAYALLLGLQGAPKRVLPGNPACSLIMIRLESPDPNFRMPPGPTPLLPAERCAIAQWIGNGALR